MPPPTAFILMHAARTPEEFEPAATQAARLKPFGRVEVTVGALAGKAFHELPQPTSAWHEYTSTRSVLERIVPHPKLRPFTNQKFVDNNFKFLQQQAAILRKLGVGSALGIHAPWFLPEAFFEKYPHLRGPRIDHPRRGLREEFAPCIDLPETQEMFSQMIAAIDREVPDLGTVRIWTNDAGGGLCWADWLYSGPNGPAHCQSRGAGPRVRDLANAVTKGITSRTPDIHLHGNFSEAEEQAIPHFTDDNFFLFPRQSPNPRCIYLTSYFDNPVRGIFDPLSLLEKLEKFHKGNIRTVFLDFYSNSQRGSELPAIIEKVIDVVEAFMQQPVKGITARLALLRKLCEKWVAPKHADNLLESLHTLHETLTYRATALPRFSGTTAGVSMRHITRPLVAIPEKLSPDEEAHWLPFVFNIRESEARNDYLDLHGGRLSEGFASLDDNDPRLPAVKTLRSRLHAVAAQLDAVENPVFANMAISLRIHSAIARSINNFYATQIVRDRNQEKLTGEPRIPTKEANWIGDPDLQLLNAYMRDEIDNTTELISLLENGGFPLLLTAKTPADEDTFLLGPDLIDQLRKKIRITRAHWLDAEKYLAPPHK